MCSNPKEKFVILIIGPRKAGKTELRKLILHKLEKKAASYIKNYRSTPKFLEEEIEVQDTFIKIIDTPGTSDSLKDINTNRVYERLREYAKVEKRVIMYVVALYDFENYVRDVLIEIVKTDFEQIVESGIYKDSYFIILLNKMDLVQNKTQEEALKEFQNIYSISQYISEIQSNSRELEYIVGSLKEDPDSVFREFFAILIKVLREIKSQ